MAGQPFCIRFPASVLSASGSKGQKTYTFSSQPLKAPPAMVILESYYGGHFIIRQG